MKADRLRISERARLDARPRSRVLVRALQLAQQFQAGGRYTLAQLAAQHGVCPRTIRRDLYALEEAGIPILNDGEDRKDGHATWWWSLRRTA